MYPDDVRYTSTHEWVRRSGESVQIGITSFAQQALGDIVFVSLVEPGTRLEAGQSVGEVESTKSVSDIYAPVTGEVTARNDELQNSPELINTDPFGKGWLVELTVESPEALDELLDAASYARLVESQ